MSNENLTELIVGLNKLNFSDWHKLADTNDPDGIFWLGYCYEFGIGVEKDENAAFAHYQKSAGMNSSNGIYQYQVGYCYYLGIGVKLDKQKAFSYYLKSAEAGNAMGIRKTFICYYYGISVEKDEDKYLRWFFKLRHDEFRRDYKWGKCAHCNEDNTQPTWCLPCDSDITTRWTSGNKDIDDCTKEFQLRAWNYENAIEWIPFNKLSDVKKIGKGGFGTVYSATWLDGIHKVEKIKVDGDNYSYKRAREPNSIVALKPLASSENNNDFLKEFKSFMECKLNYSSLAIYGITQNTKTKEYLMVFQYADNGSLHNYLTKNFSELTWQTKLQILEDTADELFMIHNNAKYIHADFHSGNILQDKRANEKTRSYIADLGLSRKLNENISTGEIYGVMPYAAPEVLSGDKPFTQASDIYGFGVIMAEMTTGQRPFDGRKFDTKLSVEICRGLRPEFASGTPKCYIELAEKCMNSNPNERPPFAWVVRDTIRDWLKKITSSEDNEIKKQFLDADKVIKSLPIPKHPDEMYTSKILAQN
ncbi:kinase-like domain-containing protein [Gigaspora rosea]|uniref:Kinase-like domain-containing protein n=1 Tax=Gigaspora rosea TaxID=44941 RepID=A0A397VXS4_9GLOM|nr:kinase-like domain-containing protein [Gigaspora rosea]